MLLSQAIYIQTIYINKFQIKEYKQHEDRVVLSSNIKAPWHNNDNTGLLILIFK